jgi:hypothetical protein
VAHRPLVQQRMEQLRAADPVEMRRRANAVLSEILAKRLDPRYRRTALDVLKRLDDQEREAMKADQETYRMTVAQMTALDAIEDGRTNRARSASGGPKTKAQSQVDIDQIINEIDQLVAAQRHRRDPEPSPTPVLELRPEDPPQVASDVTPVKEEPVSQATAPQATDFKLVRKPGHFGKGGWMRVPSED